jgi:hypothetical protein
MVAAAVRKGTGSKTVFYDFDFAIAPKTCSRENEMLVGSCMYEKVRPHECWLRERFRFLSCYRASALSRRGPDVPNAL